MDFPTWVDAIILGIVEGLTEFLPISSTGHLIVVGKWLGFDEEVFNVFIQLGALASVWWLFRERLFSMIPFTGIRNRLLPGSSMTDQQAWKLLIHVLLGFFPALVIGYLTRHWNRDSVPIIAWAMILGGVAILIIENLKHRVTVENLDAMTPKLALLVGIGQCLALCPGVSRSGATIMAGLLIGLSRPAVTEFSFLIAVPTMTAASGYKLLESRHLLNASMLGNLAIGTIVSYIVALLVVKWLIRFVQHNTFKGFAWYRIVAGLALLGLLAKGFF